MKRLFISFLLLLTAVSVALPLSSQVRWKTTAVQIDERDFIVHISADLDSSWHIYSGRAADDVATRIIFLSNPMIEKLGQTAENGKMLTIGKHRKVYLQHAEFIQALRVKDTKTPIAVKGVINYQTSNRNGSIVHRTQEFTVVLSKEN